MKILTIAPKVLNPYLGPSTVANNTLKGFLKIQDELEKKGVEITFLSLNDTESREFGNLRVVSSKRFPLVTFTGELQALIKKPREKFDIVHSHSLYDLFPWLMNKGVFKFFTMHGIVWRERKYLKGFGKVWTILYDWRFGFYYPRLTKFVAISRYVIDELKARGFDTSKAVIVENPVADKFFEVEKREENLILYPAALIPRKNQLGFLRALSLIKDELKEFKVLFTGSGDTEYIHILKDFVSKERLNVDFTGKIPYEKLFDLYSRASFVVLTSFQETTPMAIMESMATGTPVVASRVGGIPYMIQDYKNGFLVNPNNPKEIAEKLLTLIEDDCLRKKIGKNAKREAEKRWKAEIIARKLLNLYLEVGE